MALNRKADTRNPQQDWGLTDTEDGGQRRRNVAFVILSLQEKRECHLLLSKAGPCVRPAATGAQARGQLREAGARRVGPEHVEKGGRSAW